MSVFKWGKSSSLVISKKIGSHMWLPSCYLSTIIYYLHLFSRIVAFYLTDGELAHKQQGDAAVIGRHPRSKVVA